MYSFQITLIQICGGGGGFQLILVFKVLLSYQLRFPNNAWSLVKVSFLDNVRSFVKVRFPDNIGIHLSSHFPVILSRIYGKGFQITYDFFPITLSRIYRENFQITFCSNMTLSKIYGWVPDHVRFPDNVEQNIQGRFL